jgi:membrane fusion protein (multidrug efflux system)
MAHEQARRKPISEEQDQASDERADESRHDRSNAHATGQEKKDGVRGLLENPWIRYGAIALAAVLVIGSVVWWLIARNYETTDDAFIDAHIIHLSPQIAGRIARIYVTDNQLVRKGQPLVEIDSADYVARLAQAEAQQAQAETQYHQAVANAEGAKAQAINATRDLERYRYLARLNAAAVAQQQIDQASAAARNATASRDAAEAQIRGAQAAIKVAKAQAAAARLNFGYTHIVAPADGHVAQRSAAVGDYVAPGQDLMAIVPLRMWVTANYKETQLAHMRAGQPVTVSIDACSGAGIQGHVDSIQRGAGQAFAILPPQNATGNYVKVVQRVPVKIVLDRIPPECPVGPGMSVVPTVKVR